MDAWHGIQPPIGMDISRLKEKYAGRLCLYGGLNVDTLVRKTPEQVEEEVKDALRVTAAGGGYVLSSGNSLPWRPPENTADTQLRKAPDLPGSDHRPRHVDVHRVGIPRDLRLGELSRGEREALREEAAAGRRQRLLPSMIVPTYRSM